MANYRVWLTVKDSYGNTKEVDGGTISVDLAAIDPVEVANMVKTLDPYFTTDQEVTYVVENNELIKYSDFDLKPED